MEISPTLWDSWLETGLQVFHIGLAIKLFGPMIGTVMMSLLHFCGVVLTDVDDVAVDMACGARAAVVAAVQDHSNIT